MALPDFWLACITFLSGIVTYAIFRKIFRKDGLVGFLRHVQERENGGDDLILFALGLCFVFVTLISLASALDASFVREAWFVTMRRQINVLGYAVLALHFLNGRLVRQIVRWIKHVR